MPPTFSALNRWPPPNGQSTATNPRAPGPYTSNARRTSAASAEVNRTPQTRSTSLNGRPPAPDGDGRYAGGRPDAVTSRPRRRSSYAWAACTQLKSYGSSDGTRHTCSVGFGFGRTVVRGSVATIDEGSEAMRPSSL